MKHQLIILTLLTLLLTMSSYAESTKITWDGPYVFKKNGKYIAKWVSSEGKVEERKQSVEDAGIITGPKGASVKSIDLSIKVRKVPYESKADKLVILSDIHGQNHVQQTLLEKHGVIDKKGNWIFGKGCLMIVGDTLHRGPTVTEALWLMYKWSQQAQKTGGSVKFVLGNHEAMTLGGSLSYVNKKYLESAKAIGVKHPTLFSMDTILGDWLRNMPTIIKINDSVYVHGGISPEVAAKKLSIEQINQISVEIFTSKPKKKHPDAKVIGALHWCRDYFKKDLLKEEQIDQILAQYNAKRIIVGHTTKRQITPLFNKKVIGVDAGMKGGKKGELLLWENNKWSRGTIKGEKIAL